MAKSIPPSIRETAFNCPHCGALTTQYWFSLIAVGRPDTYLTPFIHTQQHRAQLMCDTNMPDDVKADILQMVDQDLTELVNIREEEVKYSSSEVNNLHLSKCFNCQQIGVWVYERLIFPILKAGAAPNSDMQPDIKKDFEEAREIVDQSPRGAAALLRLCIQKLCHYLGEKGQNIDDDIASLVVKDLIP